MPAITKIPSWLQIQNKDICWKVNTRERELFLTFDDGPHPLATPIVLDILAFHGIKATFFCIGNNVEKYPELYSRIISEGHAIGNHSWSHKNGWKTPTTDYVEDVERAKGLIDSKLMRPPYGRITPAQFRALKQNYKLIMWDILSMDYDPKVDSSSVIKNVVGNVDNGSIIVMHDNDKTKDRIAYLLNAVIDQLKSGGWTFSVLAEHQLTP